MVHHRHGAELIYHFDKLHDILVAQSAVDHGGAEDGQSNALLPAEGRDLRVRPPVLFARRLVLGIDTGGVNQHQPLHTVLGGGFRQQQGFSDTGNMQHHIHTLCQGIYIGGIRQVAAAVFRIWQYTLDRLGLFLRADGQPQRPGLLRPALREQPCQHKAGFPGDPGDQQRFHFSTSSCSVSSCFSFGAPAAPSTTPSWRSTAPMVPKKHLQSKAKLSFRTYSPS